jgi:hypothetical protein
MKKVISSSGPCIRLDIRLLPLAGGAAFVACLNFRAADPSRFSRGRKV